MPDLSEAELHGLVDGHLDADRRADVLRRAVASPFTRKRVEAWQEQSDLIRSAFNGVDKEGLPSSLDLRTPPRLHAVTSAGAQARGEQRGGAVRRRLAVAVTSLVFIAGAGIWCALDLAPAHRPSIAAEHAAAMPASQRLVRRTLDFLGAAPVVDAAPRGPAAIPTSVIPDLTTVGFTFSGAETVLGDPVLLLLRYRGTGSEQVVVGVTVAQPGDGAGAVAGDGVLTWRAGNNSYAVAGTAAPDRLDAVAATLKTATLDE